MTDRELKKLSRLELLELLLEVSKENEDLKAKVKKLESENEAAESIEKLSVAASHLNIALEYARGITDSLSKNPRSSTENETPVYYRASEEKTKAREDAELYCSIMSYYAKNREAFDSLPEELRNSVKNRIIVIFENRKKQITHT